MPELLELDQSSIEQEVAEYRQILQTDLWELCQVLYPRSEGHIWSAAVHKPVCDDFFIRKDPNKKLGELDVIKKRLWLDPRNHFKTTIDICDIVQWILCFPNVRILIASGTRDNATKMMAAVKAHFQYNNVIRDLFPEVCPSAKKVEDFGRVDSLTCPARTNKKLREPTVSVASPDSTVAGMHYDVLKFDDLVNETNSRTKEGIAQVNNWFKLTNPLVEVGGYRDVIGTRYDYSDCYGEILGDDFLQDHCVGVLHGDYLVAKRGCYLPNGDLLFPERFTREKLESERREMGTFNFSAQYLNEPVSGESQFFPRERIEQCMLSRRKLPAQRTTFSTIDLALSQNNDADFTAIVTCSVGFFQNSTEPTLFIEHIVHGHLKPEDSVMKLFEVYKDLKPVQIRTEEVGFTALLRPLLNAECSKRGRFLPMIWLKRDTRETKQARIAALQPFFERRQIRILDDCPHKEALVQELVRFPKYRRDDIVDALADHLDLLSMFRSSVNDAPLPNLTRKSGNPRLGLLA